MSRFVWSPRFCAKTGRKQASLAVLDGRSTLSLITNYEYHDLFYYTYIHYIYKTKSNPLPNSPEIIPPILRPPNNPPPKPREIHHPLTLPPHPPQRFRSPSPNRRGILPPHQPLLRPSLHLLGIHKLAPLVRPARHDTNRPRRFGNHLVHEEGGERARDCGPDEPAAGFDEAEAVC